MQATKVHTDTIKQQLREAGMTSYGALKFASNYLPTIIGDDEQVKAVVYGRYHADGGMLAWTEGMLVATDRRILFLDHKPGYTETDELTYDVVTGTQKVAAGPFASITLHTRIIDYTIRFANARCIDRFMRYIQERHSAATGQTSPKGSVPDDAAALSEEAAAFLQAHDIGVLSTVNHEGVVHGAAVYYVVEDGFLYILTKGGTQKAHDVFAHHQVAMTVFDEQAAQTVQLQGTANVEADHDIKNRVFENTVKLRPYTSGAHMPPVTTLHQEAYIVLRITPSYARFIDFAKRSQEDLEGVGATV